VTRRFKWLLVLLGAFLIFDVAALTILLHVRQSSVVAITGGKVVSSGTAAIGGPFTLETAGGLTVTDRRYRGKWMMIYFGYTFCPDACPTALQNMSVALQKLGPDAERLQALFITIDPGRDTGQVMSSYLESFDHRIVGLTGSQAQIDDVVRAYHVYVKLNKEGGENYLVEHSSYFYFMSPEGEFVDVVEGATPGDQVAEKVRKLFEQYST
jgi:protein SCO1/2